MTIPTQRGATPAWEATSARGRTIGGEPVLETVDLRLTFTGRGLRRGFDARAVDGVNLQVRPGEIVALAGESGCGKTTLARTILGLERPTGGEVRYEGRPLSYGMRALRDYRRHVQLVCRTKCST